MPPSPRKKTSQDDYAQDDQANTLASDKALSDHVVHIRRLMPFETGVVADHLHRLDRKSRLMRFGHTVSDEFLSNYAETIFKRGGIIKACFVDGICRGVGEAYFVDQADCDAEAAFSIEPRWQGHGLGSIIFERLLRAIRNRGCRTICVLCLKENAAMVRITEKLEGVLRVMPDGVTGEILRPPGNLFSLHAELMEDASFIHLALPDEE